MNRVIPHLTINELGEGNLSGRRNLRSKDQRCVTIWASFVCWLPRHCEHKTVRIHQDVASLLQPELFNQMLDFVSV